MAEIYQVEIGDSLWKFTQTQLQKRNMDASNASIMEYMNKIKDAYGCDSIDSVAKKLFIAGKSFEIKDNIFSDNEFSSNLSSTYNKFLAEKEKDTIAINDAIKNNISDSARSNFAILEENTENDSIQNLQTIKIPKIKKENFANIKKRQDAINNLPTDKDKIIAYRKEIDKSRDNYVIVDKKNFSATVYTWDGKVIKSYEVGVAKEKSDKLLRRSKKHPENDIKSTSAGIYTANYRATGKDGYRRLYNDRVLTLSNDGLKAKGLGNGETGVAFHQIPNGNKYRIQLLKREGATEANNRFSSGCVNFLPEDFDDCMSNIKGVGTKVYILPEEENNYMVVKNGELHFAQKEYSGDVATTTTKNDKIKSISIFPTNYETMRQEGIDMALTLSIKKEELANVLGLDNDTYNELAQLVLCIAGQETNYGSPLAGLSIKKMNGGYWMKENLPKLVQFAKKIKKNDSFDSRGITQCKLKSYTDEETQKLLKQYDINENNLNQPEKAAIATMIVLSCIYKNELPALKENMEKCGLTKTDAILYCYQGRKRKINDGTARPTYEYIQNVMSYKNDFKITQYEDKFDVKKCLLANA